MSTSLEPPEPQNEIAELAERVSVLRQELETIEARLRFASGQGGLPEPFDMPTVLTTNHAVRQAKKQGMLLVALSSGLLLLGIVVGVFIGRPSSSHAPPAPTVATIETRPPLPPTREVPPPPPQVEEPVASAAPAASPVATVSAAPETKKKGFVTIVTQPAAKVSEGERVLGMTPIIKQPFEPGDHTLTLESPEGVKKTVKLAVASGEVHSVRYTLTDYGF